MFKNFLRFIKHRLGIAVTDEEAQRLWLQSTLLRHFRAVRDRDDASTIALAIRADAILSQSNQSFDERARQVDGAILEHLTNQLID